MSETAGRWSVVGRKSKDETADEDPATDTHWKGAAATNLEALAKARNEAGIELAFSVVPCRRTTAEKAGA